MSDLDVTAIREQFPILSRTVREDKPLVYLDSGATSQRPLSVWKAEENFVLHTNAPVHRGSYQLAEEATDAYETARENIAKFVGADGDEIAFTKNATEALNEVAFVLGDKRAGDLYVGEGDTIVITDKGRRALEAWQQVGRQIDRLMLQGFTDEEVKQLAEYLERLRANLEPQE